MEIQQLYYYMELCKQKNFTEAGYACNMTQGALSKQIRKLENELGITLIRRNTRKFELSKEGEIFLSYAKKMTGTYEEMLKNVQKNQEIKIGCMPVLAPYHFARLVADFRKEYPDIKLVIDERIASEIQENSDRYDFLILRENMMEDQKKFRFSFKSFSWRSKMCNTIISDRSCTSSGFCPQLYLWLSLWSAKNLCPGYFTVNRAICSNFFCFCFIFYFYTPWSSP